MNSIFALAAIGALFLLVFYIWYTNIIKNRNKALEALSGIDVQLKKRSSLIPNVLAIAKKFMDHEKSLMEEVTRLRSETDSDYDKTDASAVKDHLRSAEQLSSKMGQLMVQVENYPDLKSDAHMLQAQRSYNEIESQVAASRRFYNSACNNLRNSVQIFPGNIIAGVAGVHELPPFYEADEAARQPVDAAALLN